MKEIAFTFANIRFSLILFIYLSLSTIAFGQKWTNYTNKDYITCIAIRGNQIWTGSEGGLACHDTTGKLLGEYTKPDGLIHNKITSLAIDSSGNVWIGTNGGVSKFNGNTWTNYDTTNSELISNYITVITIDSQGNKWIGTENGLLKFNDVNWTLFNQSNSGLADNWIKDIAIDHQGNKWIQTNGGVNNFDGSNWITYTKSNSGLYYVNMDRIIIDKAGNKWFAAYGVVNKFDGTSWKTYNSNNSPIQFNVYDMAEDDQGNIWFVTLGRVVKFDKTSWTYSSTNNSISSLAIDKHGNKWFGSFGDGLCKFTNGNWTNYYTSNPGLLNNSVYSIILDKPGNKWFGTYKGISVFRDTNWTQELTGYTVNDATQDAQGNKWFALDNYGVKMFDGANWTSFTYSNSGLTTNVVYCLAIDAKGNKWIGTANGVYRFDGKTWTNYKTNNSGLAYNRIYSITTDMEDNKWIVTQGGISKYNDTTWITYNSNTSGLKGIPRCIAIDAKGTKWIGTLDGTIYEFDDYIWKTHASNNLGVYTIPGWILLNPVYAIAIDSLNVKWIGTWKGGVIRLNDSSHIDFNFKNSGISDNYVHSIAIDDQGNKWIGTEDGGVNKYEDGGAGPLDLKKYKPVYGSVFSDQNGNGKRDIGEPLLASMCVKVDNDGSIATTQDNGIFRIIRKVGVHKIKFVPKAHWQLTTDSVKTIEINDTTKLITGVDFGVKNLASQYDVSIDLSGSSSYINGNTKYWVIFKNNGIQTSNGYITLDIDSLTTFISSIPAPDMKDKRKLTWNYTNLASLDKKQISLILKMPNNHAGGTILTAASIKTLNEDSNLADNSSELKQILTATATSNEKSVFTGFHNSEDKCTNKEITYTINFQNTGVDTVHNVIIRDTLSKSLDIETFRFVSSSHPITLDIKENGIVSFSCGKIKLPNSQQNEIDSRGFVKYSISPKVNLPENTVITNKAYIYFDYNAPVVTNEVKNTYITTLNTLTVSKSDVSIAAPSNSKATFDITSNVNWTISGRPGWLTLADTVGSGNSTITITALANPTTTTRTAILTIVGPGVTAQTITITQLGVASIMSMTTSKSIGSSFSFSLMANVSNTPVQIDFGDGTLVNKTIGTSETTVSGTLVGSQIVKIHGSGVSYLSCYNDQLTALDVSDNTSLSELICSYNQLSSLDLTKNTTLTYLHCGKNNLDTLDLSKNNALTVLKCYFNLFASLDVSQNVALKTFDCSNNVLTSLDVTKNTGLSSLYCSYNQLSTIDVTKNPGLTTLSCNNNRIVALDLSKNSALSFLDCKYNLLSALDVSGNSTLNLFYCNDNLLTFNTLPLKQTTWSIYSYAPQNAIQIPKGFEVGGMVDLSAHSKVKLDSTVYKWKTKGGSILLAGNDYTMLDGITTFLKGNKDSMYCEMTNKAFPDFKGGNVFKTTSTLIKLRTGMEDLLSRGVEIYTHQKMLYVNLPYRAQVAVFDLSGRLVYSNNVDSGNNSIPLQQTGIYLVKVMGDKEPVTRKVLVE